MPLVSILASGGGAVASRADGSGGATAQDGGADLGARLAVSGVRLRVGARWYPDDRNSGGLPQHVSSRPRSGLRCR